MGQSTGCSELALAEDLYLYYARPEAWTVAPGAQQAMRRLQTAGAVRIPFALHHARNCSRCIPAVSWSGQVTVASLPM